MISVHTTHFLEYSDNIYDMNKNINQRSTAKCLQTYRERNSNALCIENGVPSMTCHLTSKHDKQMYFILIHIMLVREEQLKHT